MIVYDELRITYSVYSKILNTNIFTYWGRKKKKEKITEKGIHTQYMYIYIHTQYKKRGI